MFRASQYRRRRNRYSGKQVGIAIAVFSVALHGVVIATASVNTGGDPMERVLDEDVIAEDLRFSCWSDAALAFGARSLSCALPGTHATIAQCRAQALEDLRIDSMLCDGLRDNPEALEEIAMMSEAEIAALTPEKLMDIEALDELEAAKLFEEEIEKKIEEAEARESNPALTGQVVEVTAPDIEAVPDNARFLSEFNTKVERETVARGSTEDMVEAPKPKDIPIDDNPTELPEDPTPSGQESQDNVEVPIEAKGDAESGVGDSKSQEPLLAMRSQQARDMLTKGFAGGTDIMERDGIAKAAGSADRDQEGQDQREGQEAVTGGLGGRARVPNLRPSEEQLTRALGGGSVDKLDGVMSGEFTALNSKKWKYATFFNRMKRQVAQNWHPATVYARRDPTGKVYGVKDRVTVLEVSLRPDGSMENAVVLESSGVDFLDDEAISAFERAQPFPNPPRALTEARTGLITFSFGFHFRVGSRRDTWKIFRAQ